MRHLFQKAGMTVMLAIVFISCEKATLPDADGNGNQQEDGISINFSIANIEQVAFDDGVTKTRAAIADMCSRITFAFFQNDEKVKQVSQKASDTGFGNLTVSLPAGNYKFVVLAHSGIENPTVTSLEKITFGNNGKLSDTFYYYGELSITEPKDMSLTLRRAVAMVRFITTDAVPTDVKKMKFNYTGGSSTLNAVTGLGSVNSQQEETFTIETAAHSGQSEYEIYTFPHDTNGTLKLTVTALMNNDEEYKKEIFEEVPVTRNQITKYTGKFFENTLKPSEIKMSLQTDDEWTETEITY